VSKLKLSITLVPSPRTQALLDGRVAIEGVEVVAQAAESVDAPSRAMINEGYDVAEMSLGTFMLASPKGNLIGLPVFPGRRFVHSGAIARRGTSLTGLQDLAGKRVALPQYWMTSSIWHRGMLQNEFGVDHKSVEWLTVGQERGTLQYPPDVRVTNCANTTVPELLMSGEADAALVPRTDRPAFQKADLVCLFPDVLAAQRRTYERDQVFPIMHFIAARRALIEQHGDWLPQALCKAFAQAAEAGASPGSQFEPEQEGSAGLLKDGLEANRVVLEKFIGYCVEQGLLSKRPRLEDVFFAGA